MAVHFTAHGRRLAAVGQAITVPIDANAQRLTLRAPFYRRSIPLTDITSVDAHADDGMNRGALNWFGTGRAAPRDGVRLSTGGQARLIEHAIDDARR